VPSVENDPERASVLLHSPYCGGPNLITFENWRRPKPQRGGYVRRRDFIKVIAGSTVGWPLAAHAQQSERVPRIGVLMAFDESDARAQNWLFRFSQELSGLGWTANRKPRMDVRWAGDNVDRMRMFAKELVGLKPDVILSFGTPVTAALQRETHTIPIVFAIVSDPVGEGFVVSLSHPGGNITGFLTSESGITAKMLGLLSEIAPGLKRVAILFNPDTAPGGGTYYLRDFVRAGGLLSYRASITDAYCQARIYAGRILKGQKPGELLIQLPTKFELAIFGP